MIELVDFDAFDLSVFLPPSRLQDLFSEVLQPHSATLGIFRTVNDVKYFFKVCFSFFGFVVCFQRFMSFRPSYLFVGQDELVFDIMVFVALAFLGIIVEITVFIVEQMFFDYLVSFICQTFVIFCVLMLAAILFKLLLLYFMNEKMNSNYYYKSQFIRCYVLQIFFSLLFPCFEQRGKHQSIHKSVNHSRSIDEI